MLLRWRINPIASIRKSLASTASPGRLQQSKRFFNRRLMWEGRMTHGCTANPVVKALYCTLASIIPAGTLRWTEG